jgi:hypothetical protein
MMADRVAYGIASDCDRCRERRLTHYFACRAEVRARRDDLCVAEPVRASMARRSTLQAQVLAAVQAAPEGLIMRDVMAVLGVTKSPVVHCLDVLRKEGKVCIARKVGPSRVYVAVQP